MWRTQYDVFSVYLLYWYKSTNTDAASHIQRRTQYDISVSSEIMAILALADSLAGTLTLVVA
jgi:formyltetrahydrofolate synthetase